MDKHDFKKILIDYCVFVKKYVGGDFIILFLYVDDMLIFGTNLLVVNETKKLCLLFLK